jgi:putative NADPH-quinone reductase
MRVLVLYAHPQPGSFNAAVHARAVAALKAAGHEVDDCDLYAEGFDPVLSRAERDAYHDLALNRRPVEAHVARVLAAEALVIVSPIWNFGWPALLKGVFDRVFLPGVSFTVENGVFRTTLHNIRAVVACVTYGATPMRAFLAGDPPRKIVTRALRATVAPGARVKHLALYDMNNVAPERGRAFLDKVEAEMRAL